MSEPPKTRDITLEIEIDAPADLVWRALTTPDEIARWFPPISGGSAAAVGDKLLISWGKSMEWWTTVAAVEQGKHLRWIDDPDNPAVAIDWYFETRGGKAVVRIVHSGFSASADWDDQFNATEGGWKYFLFNLRHYLQRHAGTPRVLVCERRKSPVGRGDLWQRLTNALAVSATGVQIGDETLPAVLEHRGEGQALWIRFPSLDDALLFVELEPGREEFHCGIWLSTYGLPEARVTELRGGLRATADRIFVPA